MDDIYSKYPVAVYDCDDNITRVVFPGLSDSKLYHEFDDGGCVSNSLDVFIENNMEEIMKGYDELPLPILADINLSELAKSRGITNVVESFLLYQKYPQPR